MDFKWRWVKLDDEPLDESDIPHKYKIEDFIPNVANNLRIINHNDAFSDLCESLKKMYDEYKNDNKVFDPRSRVYGDSVILGFCKDYYMGEVVMLFNLSSKEIFYILSSRIKDLRVIRSVKSPKIMFIDEGKEFSVDINSRIWYNCKEVPICNLNEND